MEKIGDKKVYERRILKWKITDLNSTRFDVPFVCGAKDLGEALKRINEGAAMIRTKGEPGTGDVVQAVRHMRMMQLGAEGVFVGSGIFKSGNPEKRAAAVFCWPFILGTFRSSPWNILLCML